MKVKRRSFLAMIALFFAGFLSWFSGTVPTRSITLEPQDTWPDGWTIQNRPIEGCNDGGVLRVNSHTGTKVLDLQEGEWATVQYKGERKKRWVRVAGGYLK